MRQGLVAIALCVGSVAAAAAQAAGVIDRVAVVVGNQVITESEVLLEVRLTDLLNGQPLELSAAPRKAAAERLVDQQLIRNEMQVGGYTMPVESEGDAVLRKFRQENYPSIPAFRAVLEKYGLTEDEVKRHLLWQAAAMRFTDQRFHMAIGAPPSQSADRSNEAARPNEADRSTEVDRPNAADRPKAAVEDGMDVWLKQARSNTRIQFKKGALQ